MFLGDSESIFTDYQHSNERNFPFYHFTDFVSGEQWDLFPRPPLTWKACQGGSIVSHTHTSENLTQMCIGKVTLGLDTMEGKKSSGDMAGARLETAE